MYYIIYIYYIQFCNKIKCCLYNFYIKKLNNSKKIFLSKKNVP